MTVLDDTKRLCFKNHLKCISINGDGEKDCINNILKLRILSRKFSEDRELRPLKNVFRYKRDSSSRTIPQDSGIGQKGVFCKGFKLCG